MMRPNFEKELESAENTWWMICQTTDYKLTQYNANGDKIREHHMRQAVPTHPLLLKYR